MSLNEEQEKLTERVCKCNGGDDDGGDDDGGEFPKRRGEFNQCGHITDKRKRERKKTRFSVENSEVKKNEGKELRAKEKEEEDGR